MREPGSATLVLVGMLLSAMLFPAAADLPTWRGWVEEMKTAPRGPFARIRWFCEDGTVLPPAPGACKPHGGGHQHGEWSGRTVTLRAAGYQLATFFADLDIDALLDADPTYAPFAQVLIERYLVQADDGWILRQARYYRGAFQEEDERRGARELLLHLASRRDWVGFRYLFLRTAASLIPHGAESGSAKAVRQLSATLAERDPGFASLRNKLHGRLERGDADAVEAYAATLDDAARRTDYLQLASDIRALYAIDPGAGAFFCC